MPLKKPYNKPPNPASNSKNIWRQNSKFFSFLLSFLVILSLLPSLPLMFAQNTPQKEAVERVSVGLFLEPLLDKYGHPSINADGSLYPTDQFAITCHPELPNSLIFENATLTYAPEVFKIVDNTDLASPIGLGTFEVLAEAAAGTYFFSIEVWGRGVFEPENVSSVIAQTTLPVQVVYYDPHFTPIIIYTIPDNANSGGSSFDCPFALIVRYDGNGPTRNLDQRAIIDDYHWEGYAQKIPPPSTLHQQLIPNLTVANFFNQTTPTQFFALGIADNITPNPSALLMVDGETLNVAELPKTYTWQTNTNHTYAWTKTLQVAINQIPNNTTQPSADEWFEWQLCLVFPPSSNQISHQVNQTQTPDDGINQLIQQFNSPNGTLTTIPIGSTVTAVYAHNKLIEKFAQEQNLSKNQTLHCITQLPLYFNSNQRYAKIQYRIDPQVAKAIITQNFTDTLHYNVTTGTTRFGKSNYFTTNFTAQYEFYNKFFNATAYQWNPTHQTWNTDPTVHITASFESAFNFTKANIMLLEIEEQTTDQIALELARTDLYDSGPQTFSGIGTLTANLKYTSPLYYNLSIDAKQNQTVTLQRTIQINFQDNQPYTLPLNLDPASPLPISVIADNTQTVQLALDASAELGGLTNLSIYQITKNPQEKNTDHLSKDQLNLKLLKTLNLTQPQQQIQPPPNYDAQTAQFYQYYEGYSSIFGEVLGFCGQTQLALSKDPTLTTLTDQDEALLYIEATNVWDTTFHQIIAVQPYSAPKWSIPLTQATIYLAIIIIAAIITSFAVYLIRAKQ